MKKLYLWICLVALLAFAAGCSAVDYQQESDQHTQPSTFSNEETTSTESPPQTPLTLGNIEYWDAVKPEIVDMLNAHNLYIDYIDSGYPCVNFHVEHGVKNAEGIIVASGLSPDEYRELVESVKKELHAILDKYRIEPPKTIFHACNSTVGIFFNNWFYDEQQVVLKLLSSDVASYQIDLLEYYYENEDHQYILRDGFFESVWEKHPIYVP